MSNTENLKNNLGSTIGPFYLLDNLSNYLNKSVEEAEEAMEKYELLYAITADDVTVFPVWQFNFDGTVSQTLQDVARILYRAELKSLTSKDGKHLPGYGWSTLAFLSANFPFYFDEIDFSQPGSEHLADVRTVPVYTNLCNGEFIEEITVEAEEYCYRMTSP